MTAQPARPFSELDACRQCGAHRWQPVVVDDMPRPDTYVCNECNAIFEDCEPVILGRD